jgi:hypothetical protein
VPVVGAHLQQAIFVVHADETPPGFLTGIEQAELIGGDWKNKSQRAQQRAASQTVAANHHGQPISAAPMAATHQLMKSDYS